MVERVYFVLKAALLSFAAPGYKHVPDWVWIVVGVLNFIAYTLGKKSANAHKLNGW